MIAHVHRQTLTGNELLDKIKQTCGALLFLLCRCAVQCITLIRPTGLSNESWPYKRVGLVHYIHGVSWDHQRIGLMAGMALYLWTLISLLCMILYCCVLCSVFPKLLICGGGYSQCLVATLDKHESRGKTKLPFSFHSFVFSPLSSVCCPT